MNQLYQSPVLYALGWAIAGSFWQMGLLWLLNQVLFAVPFRHKPEVKHAASVIFLATGMLWFTLHFFQRLNSVKEVQSYLNRIGLEADDTILHKSLSFAALISELEKFLPYFSAAYLIILALLFFRLAQGLVLTHQLSNIKNIEPAPQWQHFVNRLCVQLNIDREVVICLSKTINVPATIGFIKPVILLPIATVNQLSLQQAEAIILHEIAHIRRYDYLVNIAVSIVETILFFNPFARLLSISIRKERELCCDDFVVHFQRDPQCYAHALLSLERSRNISTLAMAATGKESLLLGRVKRILQIPDHQVEYRQRVILLFLVALMFMGVALLNPQKSTHKTVTLASHMLTRKDAGFQYFSLPKIFNPSEKPVDSVILDRDYISVKKYTSPIAKNKAQGLTSSGSLFEKNAMVLPSDIEDLALLATPEAWKNTGHSTMPFPEKKNFFDFPPMPGDAVNSQTPNQDRRPFLFEQHGISPDQIFTDERSVEKLIQIADLEKLMTEEGKLNLAIAGRPMEYIMNKAAEMQRKMMVRKRSDIQQDIQRRLENETDHPMAMERTAPRVFFNSGERKRPAVPGEDYGGKNEFDLNFDTEGVKQPNVGIIDMNNKMERAEKKTRTVVKTFTAADGTVIVIQDNGKIEITVKGNR